MNSLEHWASLGIGYTYHSKVYALLILERIQQAYEPLTLGSCENVSLGEDMLDFIKLEKHLLVHNFQSTNLTRILLLSQENLSISTLSNLGKDLEVSLAKSDTAFAKICALATCVLRPERVVCFFRSCRWCWVFSFEVVETVLAISNIG